MPAQLVVLGLLAQQEFEVLYNLKLFFAIT